jgi:ubiquinone/menaquinone biosynthesis C-methylase UbiE
MWKLATYLATVAALCQAESYIPKYVEGTPISGQVTALDPPDMRHKPLFRINHLVMTDTNEEEDAMVHRTYTEFKELDGLIRDDFWLTDPPIELPTKDDATVETLDAYLRVVYSEKSIRTSVLFADFLSINWNGKDITFLNDLAGFLEMLLFARVPNFMPEPPRIEMDAFIEPETPFERYVYFIAFKHPKEETPAYLDFFGSYCETTLNWDGPEDNSDVIHPSLSAPLAYPEFYNYTYVHFLPGGYLNGHTVRISFLGNTKFSFLDEDLLTEWLVKMYFDEKAINPKVILDVGSGTGGSAFVLGELFPEATVTGIDMAPTYIRFSRAHKDLRNATNVEFYQANAEDMSSFLEDNSVDFINFAYVLHEMPAVNAKRIVNEMFRVLKPGGQLNGFDVPYKTNSLVRDYFVSTNTWDEDWNVQGNQGPEPYIGEYEYDVMLPKYMSEIGFENVNEVQYSYFESIFTATKP